MTVNTLTLDQTDQNKRSQLVVGVATALVNLPLQLFLWTSLYTNLVKHQWSPGMYGMFGWGAVLVAITGLLLLEVVRNPTKRNWLAIITFGVVCVSLLGNIFDVGVMVRVGVPVDSRDLLLTAIVLICGALLLVSWRWIPLLREINGKDENKRWLVIAGFSTRVITQSAIAILALLMHNIPLPLLPLVAITFVVATFLISFLFQYKYQHSAANKANVYLWTATAGSVVLLWIAFLVAAL